MMPLKKYLEFVEERQKQNLLKYRQQRNQELSNITESAYFNRYAIEISIPVKNLLTEHQQYKQFQKSTNLYRKDAADLKIPVQAHYHIVTPDKEEIYAVNVDGSAHHKRNRGYLVPKKEAEELRRLGVAIPTDRIIESMEWGVNESLEDEIISFILIIEGSDVEGDE